VTVAEPLKHRIDRAAVERIGAAFALADSGFDVGRFVRDATQGLETLELMERAEHVAAALDEQMPVDDRALETFIKALGEPIAGDGMGSLVYFVHSCWLLSRASAADFDLIMYAAEELTRRFSSEFVVRPLMERDPERALAWLQSWHESPDHHLRRLVSEGTRPRLPWAPRLRVFEGGYEPIAELLDALADDPSEYVRRSVANHVGDLAKDDVELALRLCRPWHAAGTPELAWVVRHALRHPIKRAEPGVLALFGFADDPRLDVQATVTPVRARMGEAVVIAMAVTNPHSDERSALIDLVVRYRKADGSARPKVFKLKTVTLAPGAQVELRKKIRLEDFSTRKHYAGRHEVAVQMNGRATELGAFELLLS
jgi:3-methyladenine DNA glycosylase AlkC